MATKVFISWGGDLSKKLANEIKTWLPNVLQSVKPYFTPEDIQKGARWEQEISKELESSNVGILCLTNDNINRPWIIFEAGALSKNVGKANVCPILFNIENTAIEGPLSCFQSTKFEKEEIKKLVKTINMTAGDLKLEETNLNAIFEKWWPDLETNINRIISEHKQKRQSPRRSDRELIEEILELARMNSMNRYGDRDELRNHLANLLTTLDDIEFKIIDESKTGVNHIELIYPIIERLCFDFGEPDWFSMFMDKRTKYYQNKGRYLRTR